MANGDHVADAALGQVNSSDLIFAAKRYVGEVTVDDETSGLITDKEGVFYAQGVGV